MSKQLQKLKNLVFEIEEIQKIGQKKAPDAEIQPAIAQIAQTESSASIQVIAASTESKVDHLETQASLQTTAQATVTTLKSAPSEATLGQVSMVLTGGIAVEFRLEESEEVIRVRRIGDSLAISFADGKSVHLPIKSVA